MASFRQLTKGIIKCPECGKKLYADVDNKGNTKGLACMNKECFAYEVTRTIRK